MTCFNLKKCIVPAVLAASVIIPMTSQADVVISGTRVIYQQKNKDITVRLDNKGNKPLLVQSWLDDGREGVNPQEMNVPFVITPPISRIDPKRGQTVRISSLGGNLPKDRESVYWFNVLEVPPKAKGADTGNTMQLAFRTRIKFFYRPTGLQGDPAVAAQSLKWSVAGQGSVEAKNDSNYFVSLNSASLTLGGKKYAVETKMVSPHSSLKMSVKGLSASASGAKLTYAAINDFGGAITKDVTL
ncbi:fimbrial chaperone [Scandinavium sp. H11S7]|uniref:Fimbrial chaperone n=1 Tax=Scandinavium hiltneri TaxID=2926519 RepID=A0ABT2E5K4_9ENTR|nr:fimbrial chaperone [Scandinavium hiltneri]MCS2158539.1 fimbrial chaperone [Scandinavium hiltneri]MCS2163162.1 fimbrial chaperone [Scandinavium hiltneri]